MNCLICEDEESSVVKVALDTLPNTLKECSKKNCHAEAIELLKEIMSQEFLDRLPDSPRLLAFVFDRICLAIFDEAEQYSSLFCSVLQTFVKLGQSQCETTAASALLSVEPVSNIKIFCDRNNIDLSGSYPLNQLIFLETGFGKTPLLRKNVSRFISVLS